MTTFRYWDNFKLNGKELTKAFNFEDVGKILCIYIKAFFNQKNKVLALKPIQIQIKPKGGSAQDVKLKNNKNLVLKN